METLVSGTKEFLFYDVVDRAEAVTSLAGATPTFSVTRKSNNAAMITNQACVVDVALPMQLRCLVDTATPTDWESDEYELYLKWVSGSETPVHGPFLFRVEKKGTI